MRVAVVVLLAVWALAAMAVALPEFVRAGHDEALILEAHRRFLHPSSPITLTLDSTLWLRLSREVLILGWLLIVVLWSVAFARRGSSRLGSAVVVVLFGTALLGTWLCGAPVDDRWWAPANGQDVGSLTALYDWMTQDRQAAAVLLTVSILAAVTLLVIAVRRPTGTRPIVAAPPGWYSEADGLRYWDGASWTGHTAPAVDQPSPSPGGPS
jgi:hypothetical protein